MSCRLEQQLGPYLEGELSVEACRRIEQHLQSCPSCGRVLRELRATVDLLRLVPEPSPAPELRHAVMDRIATTPDSRWALGAAWLRAHVTPLPAALAALAATALVVVVVNGSDAPLTTVALGSLTAPVAPRAAAPSAPLAVPQPTPGTLRPAATGHSPRATRMGTGAGGVGAGGAAHDGAQRL
ncbi:MAG: hypothetical protein GWO02_12490, partial [Gammaproteobacteria bacterium]|nr:hypothetical protein [Gammaproteobacteria bacterium]